MLDEVLLESAGDLLIGERGDRDHRPELALEPLVQPVELLVASGHLEVLMCMVICHCSYCPGALFKHTT